MDYFAVLTGTVQRVVSFVTYCDLFNLFIDQVHLGRDESTVMWPRYAHIHDTVVRILMYRQYFEIIGSVTINGSPIFRLIGKFRDPHTSYRLLQ